eukprot:12969966-Alexandrium_andersonii.AAC.1
MARSTLASTARFALTARFQQESSLSNLRGLAPNARWQPFSLRRTRACATRAQKLSKTRGGRKVPGFSA